MPSDPEVTVVIPTHDRWLLLSAALASALAQEEVELEVAVVDDGSADETPARLGQLRDPRVRVLRHEESRGQAAARNTGIATARGAWLAFLDDDDLWSPRKLRTQLDAVEATDAVFAYAGSVVMDDDKRRVSPDAPIPDPAALRSLLLRGNVIPGGCSSVLARTEAVRRLGGFDERLSQLSDWDMWLRLADLGPAAACSEVLVAYRRHSRNLTRTNLDHMEDEVECFASKHASAREMAFDRIAYARWLAGEAAGPLSAARVHARAAFAYRNLSCGARAVATLLGGRALARAGRRARSLAVALSHGRPLRQDDPAPDWLRPYP
jgi:glycosyltransferase involved in cell wall biosynthesis